MRRWSPGPIFRAARFAPAVAFVALAAGGGGAGCSLLLDYESNPYSCVIDSDCQRYANAVCDNARKVCVPRFPTGGSDAGVRPADGGDGGRDDGPGALTCELSFDNSTRLTLVGPDGGLRPLPEGP